MTDHEIFDPEKAKMRQGQQRLEEKFRGSVYKPASRPAIEKREPANNVVVLHPEPVKP